MENPQPAPSISAPIAQMVAGYGGYEQSVVREGSDQKIRLYLQQKINSLLTLLEAAPVIPDPEDQARLLELVQNTSRKLLTIRQSLTHPTYVGAGFFSKENLSRRRLERLYEFERAMLREVENLTQELNAIKSHPLYKDVLEDHSLHIQDFIDTFNQSLFEREALMLDEEY